MSRSKNYQRKVIVLVAGDDNKDQLLIKKAFSEMENGIVIESHFMTDNKDLLEYLYHRGRYSEYGSSPAPDLIFLKLDMPEQGGSEIIREIRLDSSIGAIPIAILAMSGADENNLANYDDGANAFMLRPKNFKDLIDIARFLCTIIALWDDA